MNNLGECALSLPEVVLGVTGLETSNDDHMGMGPTKLLSGRTLLKLPPCPSLQYYFSALFISLAKVLNPQIVLARFWKRRVPRTPALLLVERTVLSFALLCSCQQHTQRKCL